MVLAIVLKCLSLLVALFGTVCAIVMWFLGGFNLGGFTTGIALILLNVLIGLAELRPSLWVEQLCPFLLKPIGKCLFLVTIGVIFAGGYWLWIACWVTYWLLAGVYLLVHFVAGSLVGNATNAGFKQVPDPETAAPAQPQSSTGYSLMDSYSHIE
jgi:hypothetical protein